MKGLLTKDFYIIFREVRFFLLIVILFSILRNGFTQGFAIMYASMLPITVLSYDEQSKWDYLAEMMPYRRTDLILSKYITGYLATAVIAFIQAISSVVYYVTGIDTTPPLSEQLIAVVLYICCALLLMAINLPILFKLGAEKGRMFFLLITMACALAVVSLFESSLIQIDEFCNLPPAVYLVAFIVFVVIAQMVSLRMSVKFYTARRV